METQTLKKIVYFVLKGPNLVYIILTNYLYL